MQLYERIIVITSRCDILYPQLVTNSQGANYFIPNSMSLFNNYRCINVLHIFHQSVACNVPSVSKVTMWSYFYSLCNDALFCKTILQQLWPHLYDFWNFWHTHWMCQYHEINLIVNKISDSNYFTLFNVILSSLPNIFGKILWSTQ